MSDEELVTRISKGEILVFEELVKKYEKKLRGFAFRIVRNEEEAAEVTQETLVSAYKHLGSFDTKRKFSSWLFQIAKNKAMDYWRKKSMQARLSENITDGKPEEIERLGTIEQETEIQSAVGKLPDKQKEAVKWFYFEDLTYDQISQKMKLPVNTVRSHLFRAKVALKKIIWHRE